jgi:hypothetical protein
VAVEYADAVANDAGRRMDSHFLRQVTDQSDVVVSKHDFYGNSARE